MRLEDNGVSERRCKNGFTILILFIFIYNLSLFCSSSRALWIVFSGSLLNHSKQHGLNTRTKWDSSFQKKFNILVSSNRHKWYLIASDDTELEFECFGFLIFGMKKRAYKSFVGSGYPGQARSLQIICWSSALHESLGLINNSLFFCVIKMDLFCPYSLRKSVASSKTVWFTSLSVVI